MNLEPVSANWQVYAMIGAHRFVEKIKRKCCRDVGLRG